MSLTQLRAFLHIDVPRYQHTSGYQPRAKVVGKQRGSLRASKTYLPGMREICNCGSLTFDEAYSHVLLMVTHPVCEKYQ